MSNKLSIFKTAGDKVLFMEGYEAALSRWPLPNEALTVPTRFGGTHIMAAGPLDAPPLVLLPGAGTGSAIWSPVIAGLTREFRTYALDIVGDAGKSVPERPMADRFECAEWLINVFDEIEVGRAFFAGISYGGWLAMNLALLAPERVAGAALIAPAATFAPLGPVFYRTIATITLFPFRPVVRAALGRLSTRRDEEFERWVDMVTLAVKHCRPKRVFPTVFDDEELKACRIQVLMLAGEKECLYDLGASVERARRLLPSFEYEVLPDAGHVVQIDQPERVVERITMFMKRPPSP